MSPRRSGDEAGDPAARSAAAPKAPSPGRSGRQRGRLARGASEGDGVPKKKKAGGARRTRVKARINKKSGDVRSLPDAGASATGAVKRRADAPLSGKAVRYLRGLGHHLNPVLQIGKEGVTDEVVAALEAQLKAHELVKVKVGTEAPIDRKEAGPELAERAGAFLAQILGRTLLLYKRHPNKPKIELPR